MMPPQSDEDYSPQEMLSMLRQQVEMGADEALLDEPFVSSPSFGAVNACLLYTSPSPRDLSTSRMPSSA